MSRTVDRKHTHTSSVSKSDTTLSSNAIVRDVSEDTMDFSGWTRSRHSVTATADLSRARIGDSESNLSIYGHVSVDAPQTLREWRRRVRETSVFFCLEIESSVPVVNPPFFHFDETGVSSREKERWSL